MDYLDREVQYLFELEQALAFSSQIIHQVHAIATQFALSDFGAIDLPPAIEPTVDRTHLQTVAPLYLAAELEAARLLLAVETIVGLAMSGGLRIDTERATSLVAQFWHERHQRFTVIERQAIFARLFGSTGMTLAVQSGRNTAFEPLMIDLTEALYKTTPGSRMGSELPVRMAAERLAANLLPRSGGIAGFAAQELLKSINQALAVLKQPAVQQAVGTRSVWSALQETSRNYLHETVDVSSHIQKGTAGMQVLAWLAGVLPDLNNDAAQLVPPDHPVLAAANVWLQASLNLVEQPAAPVLAKGMP